ncbi:MAG: hypothetical protein AAFZ18_13125 [Myxococcota bacterium]
MSESQIPDRFVLEARRALEKGRWRWAAENSLEIVPLASSALIVGAAPWGTAAVVTALYIFSTVGGWWRSEVTRGAVSGSWLGLAPLLLAGGLRFGGPSLSTLSCYLFCSSGAFALGLVGGVLLGRRSAGRPLHAASAFVAALSAASLGCFAVGFGTLFGLATGLVLAGLPTYLWISRPA